MHYDEKIYVAGHAGLVGSALMRVLSAQGFTNVVTRTLAELDLRDTQAVEKFFLNERPAYVFLAAARVGGIVANATQPVDFLYDNLMIQTNVIQSAYKAQVKKLLFLGSSCIYPRDCPQPIKEEYLLTGPLEKTNEAYAVAKIAGLTLCKAYQQQYGARFIVAMPTNLYGMHDNFDLTTAHVLPALLAKFLAARDEGLDEVVVWGTGNVRREFLYADDLAQALLVLMRSYENADPINVGYGSDVSIKELALLIQQVVGYQGTVRFDITRPEGTPRKLLDSSRIQTMGWHAQTSLADGIARTLDWYQTTRSR